MLSRNKLSRTFASIDGSSEDFLATSRLSDSVLRQCTFLGWINSAAVLISRFLSLIRVVLVSLVFSLTFLLLLILCFARSVLGKPNEDFLVFAVATLCFLSSHLLLVFIELCVYGILLSYHISHYVLLVFFFCLYSDFWAIAEGAFLLRQLHMFRGR